jgi:arylsulfatase A-like enzyme
MGPNIEPGRIDALASHLDLGPTICDIAGLTPPAAFRGLSLDQRRQQPEDQILIENTGRGSCDPINKAIFIAARTPSMKVIYESEAWAETAREREVYDLESDEQEFQNLRQTDWGKAERQRLMDVVERRVRDLRAEATHSVSRAG